MKVLGLYAGGKLWFCGFFNGFFNVFHLTNNALTFWKCARGGFLTLVTFAKDFKGVKEGL